MLEYDGMKWAEGPQGGINGVSWCVQCPESGRCDLQDTILLVR